MMAAAYSATLPETADYVRILPEIILTLVGMGATDPPVATSMTRSTLSSSP